jgi:hypothetical protein
MAKTISPEKYPSLLRKIAWDVLPCGQVQPLLLALGQTPSSDDGAEVEHRASHARVDALAPLEDHIATYSALTARVTAAQALMLAVGEIPDPQIHGLVLAQFAESAHIGASIALAQLLDEGIISINLEKLK